MFTSSGYTGNVKQLFPFVIVLSFGLVLDRGFNHGRLTVQLADAGEDAKHWVVQSGRKVADSLYGFRG